MVGVDALASLLTLLRLPKVAALALSVLLIESRPMSLSEISSATGYAKSHLSSALKLLESSSLVERVVYGREVLFKPRKEALERLVRKHVEDISSSLSNVKAKLTDIPSLSRSIEKIDIRFKELLNQLGGDDA
jgi:DNA-binding transcriptional regulator GbsR (MarR family)